MKNAEQVVDIQTELRVHIARKYKTQTAAAEAWNCSNAFVSAVLRGAKAPNDTMLEDAGFKCIKTTKYVRVQGDEGRAAK